MERLLLNFLSLLAAALPALVFRPFRKKWFRWLFALVSLLAAPFLTFSLSFFVYALLLGLFLWFCLCRQLPQGRVVSFCLCWNGCLAALGVAAALRDSVLCFPLTLCAAALFVFTAKWLSRWSLEDTISLSGEQSISPLPLLLPLTPLLLLLLILPFRQYPVLRAVAALLLQGFTLLTVALWSNIALAVRHALESSQHSRQAFERINRNSGTELRRQLTESNNRLRQLSLAVRSGDSAAIDALLDPPEEDITYSSFLPLDAIARYRARTAREAGLIPDFQLRLGDLRGFSLTDIGAALDLMLGLMCERHPGATDTLRLRMQEWGDALILTVGRRDGLNAAPEDIMLTLRQLAEEYHGRVDFSEKEKGSYLSAVFFRP